MNLKLESIRYCIFFILLVPCLSGCWKKDLEEFKSIDSVEYSPEIAIPLFNSKLTLLDSVPLFLPELTLSDTTTINLPAGSEDATQDAEAYVVYADLKGYTETTFPVDGYVQVYFADSLNHYTDSLLTSAQTLITHGTPANPGVNEILVHIDQQKYNHLAKSSKMYLYYKLKTKYGGTGFAPFEFRIKLGIKAKVRQKI
jgi:hypothetical protein